MVYLPPILAVVTLGALSYAAVLAVRRWAARRAVLDVPNHRSMHRRPTPTGGGLAIAGLGLAGLLAAALGGLVELDRQWIGYLLAASLVASVSWLDDLRPLSSQLRLVVHVAAAAVFLSCGPCWNRVDLPWIGTVHLEYCAVPLTFVWLVGLTNAYNFMDGLDGLAAAQGTVAAAAWLMLGWLTGQPTVVLMGMLLLAGSVGFLLHNWPPARVFMGDVGSTFLGFTFATIGVMAAQEHPRLTTAAVLVVWPFVFDAGSTFVGRLFRRENVFKAHRTHLYQRLATAGWPAHRILLLYGTLSLVGLALATRFLFDPTTGRSVVLTIPALALGLWVLVRRRESWANARAEALREEASSLSGSFWVRVSPTTSVADQPEASQLVAECAE